MVGRDAEAFGVEVDGVLLATILTEQVYKSVHKTIVTRCNDLCVKTQHIENQGIEEMDNDISENGVAVELLKNHSKVLLHTAVGHVVARQHETLRLSGLRWQPTEDDSTGHAVSTDVCGHHQGVGHHHRNVALLQTVLLQVYLQRHLALLHHHDTAVNGTIGLPLAEKTVRLHTCIHHNTVVTRVAVPMVHQLVESRLRIKVAYVHSYCVLAIITNKNIYYYI